jgi:hypothetical protein
MAQPLRLFLRVFLTGGPNSLPDVLLKSRNAVIRLSDTEASTGVVTVAHAPEVLEAVIARPDGALEFWVGLYTDSGEQATLMLSAAQTGVSVNRGPGSQSITVHGEVEVSYDEGQVVPVSHIVRETRTIRTGTTWRLPVRPGVFPKDTLEYQSVQLTARDVTYEFSSPDRTHMEVLGG